MELGQRIRQARTEAGLSQRQVCGNVITRNMLSLIEHGSAKPSMDTLQYLAEQLHKPMSYFLGEDSRSPNEICMQKARSAPPEQVLEIFSGYVSPDPVFDWEKNLLEALTCLNLAEKAVRSGRLLYGADLLEQARKAGTQTAYYTPELERRRLLLLSRTHMEDPAQLAAKLPDNTEEILLRAEAALGRQEPELCADLLRSCSLQGVQWHHLMGQALMQQKQYGDAASHFLLCGESPQILEALEICFREMGDFKKAYEYACRRR